MPTTKQGGGLTPENKGHSCFEKMTLQEITFLGSFQDCDARLKWETPSKSISMVSHTISNDFVDKF
jgi:hypothetical protein